MRLCKSIARVCGLAISDPFTDSVGNSTTEAAIPDDLRIEQTFAYGCPLTIERLWERLGLKKVFTDILKAKKLRAPYERALFTMTANRLCEPESKLGVWDRWLSKVYLPSCQELKLKHMYEAMDLFYEHAAEVEETTLP